MKLPYKILERKLFTAGYRQIIAVDEVGMGALAGPVVVCAARFNKTFFQKTHKKLRWLRDSKLLSPKKRAEFQKALIKLPGLKYQISYCYPQTIDRLNIYQAARTAMRRAVNKLTNDQRLKTRARVISSLSGFSRSTLSFRRTIVFVDGRHKIAGLNLPQLAIVKGDRKVFAIACASIIAKVYRDKMMVKYAKRYPNYGFSKHKGYGTKRHLIQLAAFGPSKLHRKSFAPVAKLL